MQAFFTQVSFRIKGCHTATTRCRYGLPVGLSCTSPAANTPSTLVLLVPGIVLIYPVSSISIQSLKCRYWAGDRWLQNALTGICFPRFCYSLSSPLPRLSAQNLFGFRIQYTLILEVSRPFPASLYWRAFVLCERSYEPCCKS